MTMIYFRPQPHMIKKLVPVLVQVLATRRPDWENTSEVWPMTVLKHWCSCCFFFSKLNVAFWDSLLLFIQQLFHFRSQANQILSCFYHFYLIGGYLSTLFFVCYFSSIRIRVYFTISKFWRMVREVRFCSTCTSYPSSKTDSLSVVKIFLHRN